MPFNRLSTEKIAKAVGCHANTVRLYEKIGFISPVTRSPKGYRLYEDYHLDQMRLARLAMEGVYPGPNIRAALVDVVKQAAAQEWTDAVDLAYRCQSTVRLERELAESAVAFLESWAKGKVDPVPGAPLQIRDVAKLLSLTTDVIRNWERSGLLTVPRSKTNRYRQYGAAEVGRVRVIRMLRQAGYSPMAILRMLIEYDKRAGQELLFARGSDLGHALRHALDTPRADEDVILAADRWLSTLEEQENRAQQVIDLLCAMQERYS